MLLLNFMVNNFSFSLNLLAQKVIFNFWYKLLLGNTRGLCGTFSDNQKDDFITPEGDIESRAISFANKWKCDEFCPNIPEKESDHPCDLDPQKRATAKQYCSYLFSDIFAGKLCTLILI